MGMRLCPNARGPKTPGKGPAGERAGMRGEDGGRGFICLPGNRMDISQLRPRGLPATYGRAQNPWLRTSVHAPQCLAEAPARPEVEIPPDEAAPSGAKRWNLQMVCRGKRSRAGKRPAASTIFTCQASTSGRVRPRNGACGRPSGRVQTARLGTRWKTVGPLPPPGSIFIHPERPRGPCMRGCGRCFRVRPEPPVGTPDRARAARQVLRDAKSAR